MEFKEILFQIRKTRFLKEKKFFSLFLVNCFLNLSLWLYFFYLLYNIKGKMILEYNYFLGVTKLGEPISFLKIPLIGLIIFLVNSLLSFKSYLKQKKNLAEMFFYVSLVCQVIFLISMLILQRT